MTQNKSDYQLNKTMNNKTYYKKKNNKKDKLKYKYKKNFIPKSKEYKQQWILVNNI